MGNCQAAEAATVVIHHPAENKIERMYWSVSASDVMSSNPGHYVAVLVTSPTLKNENGSPLKQLKLLRPDDTLLIGHVYRLVSFEEVLNEFAAKKCVKLGQLLREGGGFELKKKKKKKKKRREESGRANPDPNPIEEPEKSGSAKVDKGDAGEESKSGGGATGNTAVGGGYPRRHHSGGRSGQWRPALHSISEIGTS